MKNKIYTIPLFSAVVATLLFITACSQEPIFYAIEQEIELDEASIRGNIYSIVKLGNQLYTANGKIYTKALGIERGWKEVSKAGIEDFNYVVQLASDATNLYALTAKQTDVDGDEHSYAVWVLLNGTGTWQVVPGTRLDNAPKDAEKTVVIFDNAVVGDATTTTGRKAYVRVSTLGDVENMVKLLNGTTTGGNLVGTNGATTNTLTAAALGATDYFADTRAFASNGTRLYRANGTNIQSGTTAANLVDSSVTVNATPTVFAFNPTNDRILVGTENGLQEVTLTGGVPNSTSNLPGNAEATTGEAEIFSVASFGPIDNDAIYAGASEKFNTRDNALWGFYPSRGNWNFE